MLQKENVAEYQSATYPRDAGMASILKNCSTERDCHLLCDTKAVSC